MTPNAELSAALQAVVMRHLREKGRFHLFGFGTWTLATRSARRVRNPVTKELMMLPASVEVRFHAAKRLKSAAVRALKARQCESDTQTASEAT